MKAISRLLIWVGPLMLAACAPTESVESVYADADLAAVSTSLAVVDVSEEVPPLEEPTTEDRSDNPNRVICRKVQVVGTHRRKEVCHTVAELEAMQAEAQRLLRESGRGVSDGRAEAIERRASQALGL